MQLLAVLVFAVLYNRLSPFGKIVQEQIQRLLWLIVKINRMICFLKITYVSCKNDGKMTVGYITYNLVSLTQCSLEMQYSEYFTTVI